MMKLEDHQFASACPYCARRHQFASNATDGPRPKDGDYSLCIGCGHFGIFDHAAPDGIRRTTAGEAAEISMNPDASRVQLAWRMADQRRRAAAQGRGHA
ncbi:hypothetical protein VAR608DRAFT_4927 [Variovorax sp. HW608]|uniref:hypothetical protein n=1 Tax=Variovorax sp. HW608 TaxID=1034889 RepID=UPI00081FDD3C|nr:hypothetical protein [Variovorax sp. HW608]SCK49464.1 hypothetical protein VAR608DRAFT_4927 [Variovorax sp. HW608]